MNQVIPTPFSAQREDAQFMDHYRTLPDQSQILVIAILFLAILAAIVILRDMVKTAAESEELAGG